MIGRSLAVGMMMYALVSPAQASDADVLHRIYEKINKDQFYQSHNCESYLSDLNSEERSKVISATSDVIYEDFIRAALGIDSFVSSNTDIYQGVAKDADQISRGSDFNSELIQLVRNSEASLQKGAAQKKMSDINSILESNPTSGLYMFCAIKEADNGTSELGKQIKRKLAYIEKRPRKVITDHFAISVTGCKATASLSKDILLSPKPWDDSRFYVVDATFKNIDSESRVPSEGSLFIFYNGREYKYDSPEPVLDNRYGLRLQAVNPLLTLKTKLVYRIPNELEGEVFWEPGRNKQAKRIWCGNLEKSL